MSLDCRGLALGVVACLYFSTAPAFAEPADSQKLTALGYRYLAAGDDRSASTILTRAIVSDPSNMTARRYLAQAQLHSGLAQSACSIMETTARCQPNAENLACLGDAYVAMSRFEDAESAYSRALRCSPSHQGATVGLVNVCVALKQYDRAQNLCRTAIAQTKDAEFAGKLNEKLVQIIQYSQPITSNNS